MFQPWMFRGRSSLFGTPKKSIWKLQFSDTKKYIFHASVSLWKNFGVRSPQYVLLLHVFWKWSSICDTFTNTCFHVCLLLGLAGRCPFKLVFFVVVQYVTDWSHRKKSSFFHMNLLDTWTPSSRPQQPCPFCWWFLFFWGGRQNALLGCPRKLVNG